MQAAIGYLRVSTKEQGRSGLGLAAQRRDIETFGAREGSGSPRSEPAEGAGNFSSLVDTVSYFRFPVPGQPGLRRILNLMGSNYSKTPHVCFKAEFPTAAAANDELPQLLKRQLDTRFDSVRVIKARLLAPWAVVLQAGGNSYSAVLGRSKYATDEWILIISPPDGPRSPGSGSDAAELVVSCRKIHDLLTATPNVSAVRWYFEGFRNQTAALATPEELPWTDP
jgi:hypothetical protein